MIHKRQLAWLLNAAILLASTAYAQSLGDVARQQREKVKENPTPRKVITNDDISEIPETSADLPPKNEQISGSAPPESNEPKKTGDQWKAEIQGQRNAVESLQEQIDKLKASIRFGPVTEYNNGYSWNQQQLKKQDQVERLQDQLEEQKKRLEDMQEGARKQGFGNSVYEPTEND